MKVQNEQDIPIDIHANKLLDWLVSRRHCKIDWQKDAVIIRQKINSAIQDMPETEEIMQLLAGTYINYFHCCRIVELLKETEASSKNIFGQYSSQRMIDWQEIVKLYEKDSVYIAEAAQMLVRNVNYEVPSLKKQIQKCKQTQEECLQKEAECVKTAAELKEKYYSTCREIGIEGKNVKKELISLLDDLPSAFSLITKDVKKLECARDYYVSFLNFTLKKDMDECCLPVTKHLIVKGNTTTYEYRTGEEPEVVEGTTSAIPLDLNSGCTETADDQIDFGDFIISSESGDDRSSSSPNGDFVHVEREDCKVENGGVIDFGDNEAEINWDITVESSDIAVLEPGKESEGGKVARGTDALSILENQLTRKSFYNELLELECFLEQRLIEMSMDSDVLSSNQFQSAPPFLQLQSSENVQKMLTAVKDVSQQLMSVKLKHLYLIKELPNYVDRLTDALKAKLEASERMLSIQKAMTEKYKDLDAELKVLEPKVDLIIQKTKVLQSEIEAEISKWYKNRPVNIMGSINAL